MYVYQPLLLNNAEDNIITIGGKLDHVKSLMT